MTNVGGTAARFRPSFDRPLASGVMTAPHFSKPIDLSSKMVRISVMSGLTDLTVAIGVGVGLAIRLRQSKLEAEEWHAPDQ